MRASLSFGFICGLIATSIQSTFAAPRKADQPNVVVIVADDLGYGDIGVYGCKDIPTPHIDSLAKHGVRFTDGYVSCPVCSPTRAGLLTGRYQQRFGHEFNPGATQTTDPRFGLPLSERTLADRLQQRGYATGAVGKWHLGYRPEFQPLKRGFDEYFGFLAGARTYLHANAVPGNPILRGTEPVEEMEYLTDAFRREAVEYIERHRAEPFFLYLAFNAVHAPLEAADGNFTRFPEIAEPKRRTYAAMLAAMDDAVGAVLESLRKIALEERTLVIFVSDNGGPTKKTTSRNDPLRGYKGEVWEGGIRVPFLMQWKGHLPAGKVYDQAVMTLDILPTVVAAAGGSTLEETQLDGVNLLPYLTGENSSPPHAALFWRFGQRLAVRAGRWKLIKQPDDAQWKLFDLSTDLAEKNDLAAHHPEEVSRLVETFAAWNSELAEPRWNTPR